MEYLSHTKETKKEMLESCGVASELDFLQGIDKKFIVDSLSLPVDISEMELIALLKEKFSNNVLDFDSYLGCGMYHHFVPAAVNALASRSEFYTAYTPYQPEASQGTLQAIYEYQSMICNLFNMPVANASLYDGASAMAEAVLTAFSSARGKKTVLVSEGVNPAYVDVLKNYTQGLGINIKIVSLKEGETDTNDLEKNIDGDTFAFVAASPNYYSVVEDMHHLSAKTHDKKICFIAVVNPISLSVFSAPGDYGADIAVAEGQVLGNGLYFGGGALGIFTCSAKFMRKMPGRVVGKTVDADGKEGFVLTLQTREQHIRRDKATSNICSNQAHNALKAGIYLSLLGNEGLKKVAHNNIRLTAYAASKLKDIDGINLPFEGKTVFNELLIQFESKEAKEVIKAMTKHDIFAGVACDKHLMISAFTETKSKADIDKFVEKLRGCI